MRNHEPKRAHIDQRVARELYEKGLSDPKIGEALGVSKSVISGWRKRNSLPPNIECTHRKRPRQLTPLERDAIAAREAGLTYGQYKARQYAAAHPWIGGRK